MPGKNRKQSKKLNHKGVIPQTGYPSAQAPIPGPVPSSSNFGLFANSAAPADDNLLVDSNFDDAPSETIPLQPFQVTADSVEAPADKQPNIPSPPHKTAIVDFKAVCEQWLKKGNNATSYKIVPTPTATELQDIKSGETLLKAKGNTITCERNDETAFKITADLLKLRNVSKVTVNYGTKTDIEMFISALIQTGFNDKLKIVIDQKPKKIEHTLGEFKAMLQEQQAARFTKS